MYISIKLMTNYQQVDKKSCLLKSSALTKIKIFTLAALFNIPNYKRISILDVHRKWPMGRN